MSPTHLLGVCAHFIAILKHDFMSHIQLFSVRRLEKCVRIHDIRVPTHIFYPPHFFFEPPHIPMGSPHTHLLCSRTLGICVGKNGLQSCRLCRKRRSMPTELSHNMAWMSSIASPRAQNTPNSAQALQVFSIYTYIPS